LHFIIKKTNQLDIKLILKGAKKSEPIKVAKKMTRLDVKFFKNSDFEAPLNPQSIQRVLSKTKESVTFKEHVCSPRGFHSRLKYSCILSNG